MSLVAEQFESLEKQAHAAKLGMVVFLASETLIFGGLFALIASYKTHYPEAFRIGIAHNTHYLGAANTANIIVSSTLVASSVHTMRKGMRRTTATVISIAMFMGACFVAIKLIEYFTHFGEGIFPGGQGEFFREHRELGLMPFWTLYYISTALHLLHLLVGEGIMAWLLVSVLRGTVHATRSHPLLLGAMYWQLVDSVWMFLWPLFYLK